jgi:hypothetical protein
MEVAKSEKSGGLHEYLKLKTLVPLSTMVLIDASGAIRTYDDARDILEEFFLIRFVISWICWKLKS